MNEESTDRAEYISYNELQLPSNQAISQQALQLGFDSQEWLIQFQTISNLPLI